MLYICCNKKSIRMKKCLINVGDIVRLTTRKHYNDYNPKDTNGVVEAFYNGL